MFFYIDNQTRLVFIISLKYIYSVIASTSIIQVKRIGRFNKIEQMNFTGEI